MEGRAHPSRSGVFHPYVVPWSNQAQHFGGGTRLSVLGKAKDRGGTSTVPQARTLVSPVPPWRKGAGRSPWSLGGFQGPAAGLALRLQSVAGSLRFSRAHRASRAASPSLSFTGLRSGLRPKGIALVRSHESRQGKAAIPSARGRRLRSGGRVLPQPSAAVFL